eukprot:1960247-Amphidinium_carterae.1
MDTFTVRGGMTAVRQRHGVPNGSWWSVSCGCVVVDEGEWRATKSEGVDDGTVVVHSGNDSVVVQQHDQVEPMRARASRRIMLDMMSVVVRLGVVVDDLLDIVVGGVAIEDVVELDIVVGGVVIEDVVGCVSVGQGDVCVVCAMKMRIRLCLRNARCT